MEICGRRRLAVGSDQLGAPERQAIDGVDLDRSDDAPWRKADADAIVRQRRKSALEIAASCKQNERQKADDSVHPSPGLNEPLGCNVSGTSSEEPS
jgi:hypothetical protein